MTQTQDSNQNEQFILHYNPFSICSIMVRYTLALRGTPESPETAIMVEEKYVDIYVYEQLSEKFLLQVNPKGQVSPLSYHPIKIDIYYYIAGACGHFIYTAEPSHISLEITYFLCKRYPIHDINHTIDQGSHFHHTRFRHLPDFYTAERVDSKFKQCNHLLPLAHMGLK